MMAAFGFKALGWCLCVAVVAPAFYLVTSQVAAERGRLESMERAIVKARSDIRTLETEFNTRANLAQLERWNGEVLSLAAPRAEQFVGGEAQLAQLIGRSAGEVQMANYVVPSGPVLLTAAALATAQAEKEAAARLAAVAPAVAVTVPAARSAATSPMVAQARSPTIRIAAVAPTPEPVRRKAQAVAMLDQTLLSEHTLGDLVRGARKEAVAKR